MLFKLFLLFTIVPLAELALLIKLGELIGFAPTFSLVIFTGALGALLARGEGLRVIREYNQTVSSGQLPTDPLIDGLLVVVGGVLLVTPGVMTDAVGFTVVIPYSRRIIREWLKRSLKSRFRVMTFSSGASGVGYSRVTTKSEHSSTSGHDDDDVIDI